MILIQIFFIITVLLSYYSSFIFFKIYLYFI